MSARSFGYTSCFTLTSAEWSPGYIVAWQSVAEFRTPTPVSSSTHAYPRERAIPSPMETWYTLCVWTVSFLGIQSDDLGLLNQRSSQLILSVRCSRRH
jgi:hypothetical protein